MKVNFLSKTSLSEYFGIRTETFIAGVENSFDNIQVIEAATMIRG